ncbi:MAG: lipid-A-disaccharide synthase [Candidatus Brocadiaceae bacterium]|jgi:lipid-A-disaccharide synthase
MAERCVLLSVGDDSGDLHAANLMRAMREHEPDVRFTGFGMERMVAAGLAPLGEQGGSAMWFRNLLRLGRYRRRLETCRSILRDGGVDLVVPVDFGGFNLYLCREAARRGVPVFYYIPPQVWAHGRYRLKKLRKWTTRCGLIYPFERELYRRWSVGAEYVGHPLFDAIEQNPPSEEAVSRLRERFGDRLVAIFPGSRMQEVRAHVPLIVRCCRRLRAEVAGVTFALLSPTGVRAEAERLLPGEALEIAVLEDVRPVELARASHVCIAKSGTVTLEIATQQTPTVIFYRTNPFTHFIALGLSETPYAGIVNVLAGRMVCAEKVMSRDDHEWLARQALRLLKDPEAHAACRRAMGEALEGFARPGASARAAESALELLQPC